jgi:signal transduction histidine kinase
MVSRTSRNEITFAAYTVSDVLTMSKLDSGLFVMTPVEVQLESIARDAVKMFEGEAKSHGIDLEFYVEESCRNSNIQSVSLDPTRVLQILIVRHDHLRQCILD